MAAVIKIQVETSGGLSEVKKDIADLGKTAEQSGSGFNFLKEAGIGMAREVGAAVLNLGVAAFQKFGQVIGDSISAARESNLVAAQTAQVIKSTGGAAQVTTQHVLDYASALSAASGKSLFGDEQIAQSTNLLLTFTEIKGATLDAATAISVDMAQALGGAPKDAAIQLGKALNDPVKGITALTRVGVSFSDEQKAMIKAMTEAGDTAGAQKVILDELNKEFGGSAEAAAKADGGFAQFQDRLGEMEETIGKAILPILGQFMGILNDNVLPAVESAAAAFAAWLGDPAVQAGIQQIADAVMNGLAVAFNVISTQVIPALLAAWAMIQPAIQAVLPLFSGELPSSLQTAGQTFTVLQGTIQTVMAGIQAVVAAVLPQIAAFWQAHGQEILAFVQTTWNAIQSIIQTALQLIAAIVGPALQAIAGFISAHGTEIQAILTNTWNAIKAGIDAVLTIIQGILKAALQLIQGDWSGAWTTIQQMSARVVQDLITIIESGVGNIVTLFGGLATQVISILSALPGQAQELGNNIIQGIISGISAAAGALYSKLRDLAGSALQAAQDALQSHSPSKAFADEVGVPIVQGIVQGIQAASGQLLSTLQSVAGQAVTHTSNLVAGMSDILQNSGLGSEGEQIGADLLAGIAAGIQDNVRAVTKVIDSTAKTVVGAFQDGLKIGSPSQVLADEVGAPIIFGIIQGLQDTIPHLSAVVGELTDTLAAHTKHMTEAAQEQIDKAATDLTNTIADLGDKAANALADAFSGTASLDRAKAKAIDNLKSISDAQQDVVQKQLAAVSALTSQIADPQQAAKFFKMRSDQIFEIAKLQDQIGKATDDTAKARLQEQLDLITQAQAAEQQGFNAKAGSSPLQGLIAQIQKIMGTPSLPGIFDDTSGALGSLSNLLPQLVAASTSATTIANTNTNTRVFNYSPTQNINGTPSAPMDMALAASLAGV